MSKKVELDEDHQKQINAVHDRRREKTESEISRTRNQHQKEDLHAQASLRLAMDGKIEKNSVGARIFYFSGIALACTFLMDAYLIISGNLKSFFFLWFFLLVVIRPYVLLNLVTLLVAAWSFRLRLGLQFKDLSHAQYLAKPKGLLLKKVENKAFWMQFLNQMLSLMICIFGVALIASLLGWEPAFTDMGGPRFTILFLSGMGFVTWIAMFKLFAFSDQ